uniref:Uncharacterized protein n=1 Tax=Magallana gigas TaxID=29159 RepID=K1QK80_MAGGI
MNKNASTRFTEGDYPAVDAQSVDLLTGHTVDLQNTEQITRGSSSGFAIQAVEDHRLIRRSNDLFQCLILTKVGV